MTYQLTNQLTNQRFGKLLVLDDDYSSDDYRRRFALVQCDCGSQPKAVLVTNLKTGHTQSCGLCTQRGGARKHRYRPRRAAQPKRRAETPTTAKVTDNGSAVTSE